MPILKTVENGVHCMIKDEIDTSKHDYSTSFRSIDLDLIVSFYAERERYYRIMQIAPIWFEDGFIEDNINLFKTCCKQSLYYIYGFQK